MAEGKRYYWLKLKDDFFGSMRIKKLRKIAGGDTYVIIYLKMQLKAMKNGGIIEFKGVEESIADELALDLDESVDNVRVTLSYLLGCGLAESNADSNIVFLPYAVENVGSEGSSAERMRRMREKQASASLSDGGVTRPLRISDGEKDIEKEKEIEIESSSSIPTGEVDGIEYDALCLYAANELKISPTGMEELLSFRDSMSDDMIRWAIDRSIDNGSRNYTYVRSVLNGIVESGYKSVDELKEAEERRRKGKNASRGYNDFYDNSGVL